MGVRGSNPPCIWKSRITYSQSSVSTVPHPWIQPTTDPGVLLHLLLERILIYVNPHSVVEGSTVVCHSQFPRGGDMPYHEGPHGEQPGLVRRRGERETLGKAFTVLSREGMGKAR